ncbi:hypothetical protein Bca52824_044280 [Brassica carinata]|uniref:Uncharacterized protein n=1 Tax=Brassica carinata TaxID=52824 RepID=A0A8X7S169_BRACI|nr:hypothetical protein Bca52824_044280 [Brassica carinata]
MGFKRKKGDGEGEEMESEDRGRPNSNGTERRNVILPSMIKNKTVDPQHVVSIPLCAPYHWFTPTAHFKLSNLVLRKDIKWPGLEPKCFTVLCFALKLTITGPQAPVRCLKFA